jgi:hypothetical protein
LIPLTSAIPLPPGPPIGARIAYLKKRMLPPAAEVLIKEIVDHFQGLNEVA